VIENITTVGDTGRLKIEDNTDDPGLMNVVLWIQSLSPVSVPDLQWSFQKDNSAESWKSFNFLATTLWQKLATVYLGNGVENFTLKLGETGTSQLDGPFDYEVPVYGYVEPPPAIVGDVAKRASMNVNGIYKQANVYVKVSGTWTLADPYIKTPSGWVRLS
jgi:hypothetical protein